MRDTTNGFVIAEKDLQLRGPGELLGIRQAGLPNFRIADFIRDQYLLPDVITLAQKIEITLATDPTAECRFIEFTK